MKWEIIDKKCVNSNWKARFLSTENEEFCQCSFGECKVKVSIENNGHKPYTYTLTESEINNLSTQQQEEIPQMKGTLEALDKLLSTQPSQGGVM